MRQWSCGGAVFVLVLLLSAPDRAWASSPAMPPSTLLCVSDDVAVIGTGDAYSITRLTGVDIRLGQVLWHVMRHPNDAAIVDVQAQDGLLLSHLCQAGVDVFDIRAGRWLARLSSGRDQWDPQVLVTQQRIFLDGYWQRPGKEFADLVTAFDRKSFRRLWQHKFRDPSWKLFSLREGNESTLYAAVAVAWNAQRVATRRECFVLDAATGRLLLRLNRWPPQLLPVKSVPPRLPHPGISWCPRPVDYGSVEGRDSAGRLLWLSSVPGLDEVLIREHDVLIAYGSDGWVQSSLLQAVVGLALPTRVLDWLGRRLPPRWIERNKHLGCLDAATGRLRWTVALENKHTNPANERVVTITPGRTRRALARLAVALVLLAGLWGLRRRLTVQHKGDSACTK